MVQSFPNAWRPSPGSWLANWSDRQRPHPDSFICGIRMLGDGRHGRAGRWQYRRSAVDQLTAGDVLRLYHGTKVTLRLRMDADPHWGGAGPRPRPGLAVLSGSVVDGGMRLLLAVPLGEVVRFGVADQ